MSGDNKTELLADISDFAIPSDVCRTNSPWEKELSTDAAQLQPPNSNFPEVFCAAGESAWCLVISNQMAIAQLESKPVGEVGSSQVGNHKTNRRV